MEEVTYKIIKSEHKDGRIPYITIEFFYNNESIIRDVDSYNWNNRLEKREQLLEFIRQNWKELKKKYENEANI